MGLGGQDALIRSEVFVISEDGAGYGILNKSCNICDMRVMCVISNLELRRLVRSACDAAASTAQAIDSPPELGRMHR